ncbi:DnaJ domain-containing protein [Desulfosarcina sp.]|uniref:DnaJ domain-containing protein n=1 Tax=Desulfosarcina sp. TaxID=2027861 RepID=UPI003970D3BC
MYLARLPDKTQGCRYLIRQSYADGACYRSRDLFDLGADPSRFIKYPGGNGFYIDTVVEEAIADLGVAASQDDLEPLFIPFLAPHIRRVIDGFDRKARAHRSADSCRPAHALHWFDRYRLHVLKLGRLDVCELNRAPDRFYANLHCKSRDEIEYDFVAAERILKTGELAHYTYQIFDLQRYFSENFARRRPECLDPDRMDRFFVKTLCQLNLDEIFWQGSDATSGLKPHLVRYAIMFFDSCFPSGDPFRDYLRDFMNRHRIHRPPQRVQIGLAESARLFGVTTDMLKKMDCRTLTRQYRKLAHKHHPDKGGNPDTFVKLNAAYEKLLNSR